MMYDAREMTRSGNGARVWGMASYTPDGRLGKLLRRGRAFLASAFAGDHYRPAILNLLFWGSLLVTYVFHVSGFFIDDVKLRFGPVPFTLVMGVLAALWLALPSDPRAGSRRKLVAPAFMLVLFALIFLLTGGLAVLAAFAIGICAAMVEARRRREEIESLLGELEAAHA